MSQLKSFLKNSINNVDKELGFTHTTMPGGQIQARAYCINNLDEFYKIYYKHVFKLNLPAHVTEAPDSNGISQMKVDIDLKYKLDKLDRLYDDDLLKKLILFHYEEIKNWVIELSDEERLTFVFEKTKPIWDRKETKYVKDGVHLMMPYLITPWLLQNKIREYVVKKCKEVELFKKYELINKISDVIDKAIIRKNNWLLYGSSKNGKEPYLLTKIFKYNEDGNIVEIPIDKKKYSNKKLIKLLSIRNKKAEQLTFLKPDKQIELDEELSQIIIKKQKVNAPNEDIKDSGITNANNNLKYIMELIDCLDISRAEDYQKWSELIWCCHNIHNQDDKLLQKVIEFSKKSPKYKNEAEDACISFWNKSKYEGGLGIGSLKYWARIDNLEKYNELNEKTIYGIINKSLHGDVVNISTCDISDILKNLYDNIYKCISIKNKDWYQYINHKWVKLDSPVNLRTVCKTKIYKMFHNTVKQYQATIANIETGCKVANPLYKMCLKLRDTSFLNNVMKEAENDFFDLSQNFYKDLNEKRNLLCFKNGIYDLSKTTDNFRDGRPEDNISFCTNINYIHLNLKDPKQKIIYDEINLFIKKILPDDDVREYTLKLLSSFLHGSTKNEQFHFWTGSGGNGKSKLIELYNLAIGDYACKLPIQLLTQKRKASGAAEPEMARTKGKRFVNMTEPGNGARINAGLLKELTGGDRIVTRQLYKANFEFKPQFKIVLCCNDIPWLPHNDQGLWRRVRVTEFKSKFVDDPDPLTKEIPLSHPENPREFEKEDVEQHFNNWKELFISILLNEYYPKYVREGLREPDDVIKYTRKIQEENDNVKKFWSKMIISGNPDTDKLMLKEVYRAYKDWLLDECGKKSRDIMPLEKFKKEINNNLKKINKQKYRYNDPQRVKKNKKGKTMLGHKADGWWGFKWREECASDDENNNDDDDNINNLIKNIIKEECNNNENEKTTIVTTNESIKNETVDINIVKTPPINKEYIYVDSDNEHSDSSDSNISDTELF